MSDFQSVTAVLVGVVSFITVLFYGKFLWRRSKMPPGPFPIPILGNFLQIHSDGLLPNLLKLSKAYGPVYTVHFGSRPAVIVTGYPALREVLINHGDAFLNRGTLPAADRVMHHEGTSFTNGELWKQLRQFSLQTLKDFGMGKKSLEDPILEEAHHMVEHLKNLNEQPFEPSTLLICASSNVLANMLMETRYDYNDEKWMKILQGTREAFHIMSSFWGQLYDFFPAVMEWLPGPHKRIFFLLEILEDVMKESIRNHQQTLDPACPRDFIDCYLIKMTQENNNLGKSPFTLKGLPPAIMDMFLGGTESTALTLNFGFLILMKYPELQDKMYDEIDQVVGQAREPRAENRTQMPLMNAFVHEIQRYSDVFPMGLTRSTTRDITFHGYYIPEGTDIITLLTTALRDPTQFETPEKFNIKHFLDDNGKFRKRNAFLPFSAGKRACIAESLVRMQLFLTFTIILQKFTLKSMMDPKDVDISPAISGVENIPPACKIIFSQRTLDGEV
ncbi:cytochrome P450 2F2-like isoform X1 [Rana temporaria]|uniref:cytochrome P450 2F2-like isoform X1 n=1 Tax=Rana temporaria TaxID=8407 RepID=UPI001AAD243F|nr:cytochrome P450 2F2-like isoform X1 [Rana temporaria]